jgi:hypothetical protein
MVRRNMKNKDIQRKKTSDMIKKLKVIDEKRQVYLAGFADGLGRKRHLKRNEKKQSKAMQKWF